MRCANRQRVTLSPRCRAGIQLAKPTRSFTMFSNELNKPYWLLRVLFGAVPIVAGLDKFTNLLTNWEQYLSPWVSRFVPASTFMHTVGVIEIVAGVLVLSKLTRVGAYVVSVWLVGIALNLLTTGKYFDVAVRDLVMAGA